MHYNLYGAHRMKDIVIYRFCYGNSGINRTEKVKISKTFQCFGVHAKLTKDTIDLMDRGCILLRSICLKN